MRGGPAVTTGPLVHATPSMGENCVHPNNLRRPPPEAGRGTGYEYAAAFPPAANKEQAR
jgi:hypothetical protein